MSEFKTGDRVRIKSWAKIRKTLNEKSYCRLTGVRFRKNTMLRLCGTEGIVTQTVGEHGLMLDNGWCWSDKWLEPAAEKVRIEIDPSDPKSAHAAVSEACAAYKKRAEMHKWTEDEIKRAALLVAELLSKAIEGNPSNDFSLFFYKESKLTVFREFFGSTRYPAKPDERDEYNPIIGACVALCKATGTPIPDFIKGDSDA